MPRPGLSLCLIAKNEESNISQLFQSIQGCFDEIIFVDTGSTDKTVEEARKWAEVIGVSLNLQQFAWIQDFAAARNYAFSFVKTKFAMWMDLDDVLDGRDAFINFRDHAMEHADYWLANYDYALTPEGNAAVTFLRERVVNLEKEVRFHYFVHEGIKPAPGSRINIITTWRVKHMRNHEDMIKDRSRNLTIIEGRLNDLDARLKFYHGKEAFEGGQPEKALKILMDVAPDPDLEHPDRILALQYAGYAAMAVGDMYLPEHRSKQYAIARQFAHQGLELEPTRAEYYHILGDSHAKVGEYAKAIPYYAAAEKCAFVPPGGVYSTPIFSFAPLYGELAVVNQSKCLLGLGRLDEARAVAEIAITKYQSAEAAKIVEEIDRNQKRLAPVKTVFACEDLVFVCPPQTAYPFDENIYKTNGIGGSETALVEMAKAFKELTPERTVRVFNMREARETMPSGVIYHPTSEIPEYFAHNLPLAVINWRHNIRLSAAPTYLWCHDLVTPTVEMQRNFDKILCLTPFHRDYVNAMQGVPKDQILVTRNGINPEKFNFKHKDKNPSKIVWMSSPDRGLKECIHAIEMARESKPDLELHVYYGLENLEKGSPELKMLALQLRNMINTRPWVIYHGNVEQRKMYEDVSDAVVWLHPCNFIETFCITALEMQALGIYPIARKLGALKNTLETAASLGHASLLDIDPTKPGGLDFYVDELLRVLEERRWERVSLNMVRHSWTSVAIDWQSSLGLGALDRHPCLPIEVEPEPRAKCVDAPNEVWPNERNAEF